MVYSLVFPVKTSKQSVPPTSIVRLKFLRRVCAEVFYQTNYTFILCLTSDPYPVKLSEKFKFIKSVFDYAQTDCWFSMNCHFERSRKIGNSYLLRQAQ